MQYHIIDSYFCCCSMRLADKEMQIKNKVLIDMKYSISFYKFIAV